MDKVTACLYTLRDLILHCIRDTDVPPSIISMSSLRIISTLWTRRLRHNPLHPDWYGRDRFIMSAGVNAILQYAMLYLTGYPLSLDDMKRYRQLGSITPGHPEAGLTPGVELTVGSFGEGLAAAVGLAIAEKHQAARINAPDCVLIDNATYALLCDGDLQEGASHEAASLAGTLALGGLICLYDNSREAAARAEYLSNNEDFRARFRAYGWSVYEAETEDADGLVCALDAARADREHPSLIVVTETAAESMEAARPADDYEPDAQALAAFREAIARGMEAESGWEEQARRLRQKHPEKADILARAMAGAYGSPVSLPLTDCDDDGPISPARLSDSICYRLADSGMNLFGGACLLFPAAGDDPARAFTAENPFGSVLRCGIREQALGAIMTGLSRYGGLFVWGNNFLTLSDYMRPSLRVAAMMRLDVLYTFINDSLWNGQDGPTHQPVEQLAALRAVPGLTLIRPADAVETVEAWRYALSGGKGPIALALSKLACPPLARARPCALEKGAYVIYESGDGFDLIIMATGSEVADALTAGKLLEAGGKGVRIVSMPSWELFDAQDEAYRQSILPPACKARLAVEAGVSMGWRRYVGDEGAILAIDSFGLSAPYPALKRRFAFEPEDIAAAADAMWRRCGHAAK